MEAWLDLPIGILFSISKCIPNDRDLLCFRSVCVSWRSSCPPRTPPPLPSCKLSTVHKEIDTYRFSTCSRSLFLIKGNNHSWLIKSEASYNGRMRLYCPLSAERRHFRDNVLDVSEFKGVLKLGHEYLCVTHSFDPDLGRLALIPTGTDHRFVFLAQSYAGGLAFFRSGDTHCTLLQNSYGSVDIASFNGRFYAVYQWGRTCVVDQSGNMSWFRDLTAPGLSSEHVLRYLVESENRLLLVDVGFDRPVECRRFQFRMYKLNVEMSRWDKVKLELGDQVLFLGEVGSFSLSASQLGWLRGNYILFRFRELHESLEMLYGYRNLYGDEKSIYVYDLEKGKSRPLGKCYLDQHMNLFSPAPEWFLQSDETLPYEFPFKRSLMRIYNRLENLDWEEYFRVVCYGSAALFWGFACLQ